MHLIIILYHLLIIFYNINNYIIKLYALVITDVLYPTCILQKCIIALGGWVSWPWCVGNDFRGILEVLIKN